MSKSNSSSSSGVNFFGLLTILFITLKLTNVIDWSWWLVLLPLYGSITAAILIVIAVVAFAVKK